MEKLESQAQFVQLLNIVYNKYAATVEIESTISSLPWKCSTNRAMWAPVKLEL